MKRIKIIRGFYGLNVKNAVITKSPKSEPFDIDDLEAERLIAIGIASAVSSEAACPLNADNVLTANGTKGEKHDIDSGEQISPHRKTEYDADTPASELRRIAKEHGIKFEFGIKKSDMLRILDEYFAVGGEAELPPMLTAASPVI